MTAIADSIPVSAKPARGVFSARGVVIDALFLLIALSALMIVTTRPLLVMDEDIWWHLRTGQWILANRAVPVRDMFSSQAMGQPWIAYSWLFDVLVSRTFDLWGYRGMLVMTTAAVLAYTAWLTVFFTRFTNLRRAMILAFCANLALMPLRSPRPWHFTILFFAMELSILWIARESNRPLWLLPVVPLLVVWANMHIQFVYGLGLIGLFALDSSLPPSVRKALSAEPKPFMRASWLWMLLTASCLATFLNPYGWNLYRVVVQYSTQSAPLTYVQEMQSMPFRDVSNWTGLMLICAAIFVLGAARSKSFILITGLFVACIFGFRSQRDIWFPVTLAALALASQTRTAAPAGQSVAKAEPGGSRWSFWIAIPLSFVLTLLILARATPFSDAALRRAVDQRFPEKASGYVENHAMPGPLFNSYSWGGYLIWRLPALPVSIDGRATLYEASLGPAINSIDGHKTWSEDPGLKRARTIILETDCPLASILRANPNFRVVYEDKTGTVFQPVSLPAPQ